jgi:hypothetical protein
LFSREDVANAINQNFEPSWEMLRPVPIVQIDFGNGRVVTRTAHGNVASHICTAEGQVADVLPGIYTPAAFIAALQNPRTLAGELARLEAGPRLTRWREYHTANMQRIQAAQTAALLRSSRAIRDVGKGRIERPIEQFTSPNGGIQVEVAAAPRPRTAAELASWQPLVADTQLNETTRRMQIHSHLRTSQLVRPEQIKSWLYREVLHADLDDPNMGLGDDFFADLER